MRETDGLLLRLLWGWGFIGGSLYAGVFKRVHIVHDSVHFLFDILSVISQYNNTSVSSQQWGYISKPHKTIMQILFDITISK